MRLTRGIRNGIRRVNLPDNLLRECVSSRYGYGGRSYKCPSYSSNWTNCLPWQDGLRIVAVGEKIQVVGV